MEKLIEGKIAHYVLSEQDAAEINRRRSTSKSIAARKTLHQWPTGAQAHIGNQVQAGDEYPMVIVRVFNPATVNGQVLLDGCDTFWATSRSYDATGKPFTWHWIEKPPEA